MQLVILVYDIHFGGGVERVSANMANQLVEFGYQLTIVSLSRFRTSNIFTIDQRVKIDYLNFNFENGFNLPQKIASVVIVNKYFRKYTDRTIILGIGTTYPSLILALLYKRKNLITIGCQHCSYISAKHIWSFLRNLLYYRLSALVSLTEQDLPKLKNLNKNSFVIPNSVSFFPDKPAQLENKILLAVGRMDYNKGFDLLLDVFERITLSHPTWILRIIGDGPLREKLILRVEAAGLKDRVVILPPTNQIMHQYLQASVYMMTSRTEALPMVMLEAQACGLPIVSFNCETGPSDIINNGKDGYLIDDYDIGQMNMKVSELCADFDKRKEFGQNARKNVEKFSPNQVFKKWESLFALLQKED